MRYITTWETKAEAVFGRALWKRSERVNPRTAGTASGEEGVASSGKFKAGRERGPSFRSESELAKNARRPPQSRPGRPEQVGVNAERAALTRGSHPERMGICGKVRDYAFHAKPRINSKYGKGQTHLRRSGIAAQETGAPKRSLRQFIRGSAHARCIQED